MLIPEIVLYNTVNLFLDIIRQDFKDSPNESCSMLYLMFNSDDYDNKIEYETYDVYKQAKSLIVLNDEDNPRYLMVNMGYNMESTAPPTIHILMPSDLAGRFDSIGYDESNPEENPCGTNGDLMISKAKTYQSTFHLMITSDNMGEVIIMYHMLKAMLLVLSDHMGLSGLLNLKESGQDIQYNGNLAPPNIFHRTLSLTFDYESRIKFKIPEQMVRAFSIRICENVALDNNEFLFHK